MKKRVSPAQKKAAKQKKLVIGLSIFFVAILAFMGPKTLKSMNKKPPSTSGAVVATDAPASDEPTDPNAVPVVASAPAPAPTSLPESEPAPKPGEGDLVTFGLFKTKDPFWPQLQAGADPNAPASTTTTPVVPAPAVPTTSEPPAAEPPAAVDPTTSEPAPAVPPTSDPPPAEPPTVDPTTTVPTETEPTPTVTTTTEPTTTTTEAPVPSPVPPTEPPAPTPPPPAPSPPAAPTAATISVNGVEEAVAVSAAFPKAAPLFRLVQIVDGIARIAIAGGALQDGAETVPLQTGKPLTLMNTADGTKFVLRLVSVQ